MEAVFRPEIFRIFSGRFLSTSCAFRQEPAVSGPDCSTWEDSKQKKIHLMKKRGQRIIEMKILYLLYYYMKNVEFEATPSTITEFVDQPGYVTKG